MPPGPPWGGTARTSRSGCALQQQQEKGGACNAIRGGCCVNVMGMVARRVQPAVCDDTAPAAAASAILTINSGSGAAQQQQHQQYAAPVSTAMQLRDCQFQMRMVWSSDADTIQGYSWWNCEWLKEMVRRMRTSFFAIGAGYTEGMIQGYSWWNCRTGQITCQMLASGTGCKLQLGPTKSSTSKLATAYLVGTPAHSARQVSRVCGMHSRRSTHSAAHLHGADVVQVAQQREQAPDGKRQGLRGQG